MKYTDEIEITAAPATVWALTTDVEAWPATTPTVTSVTRLDDGPLRVGSRARISQPGIGTRTWTVSALEQGRLFVWGTKLGAISLTGSHRIEPTPTGTKNTLGLEVTGFGSGLLRLLAGRRMAAALRQENEGFKRAAEGR